MLLGGNGRMFMEITRGGTSAKNPPWNQVLVCFSMCVLSHVNENGGSWERKIQIKIVEKHIKTVIFMQWNYWK